MPIEKDAQGMVGGRWEAKVHIRQQHATKFYLRQMASLTIARLSEQIYKDIDDYCKKNPCAEE